jgi:hypothetical protein
VTVSAAAFGYRPARLTVRLALGADTALALPMTALPRVLGAERATAHGPPSAPRSMARRGRR